METRPIGALRPHPQNAAIYGDQADTDLIGSIRDHGVLTPLLITKAGVVISGHRRLDAARKIGLRSVPVLLFDGDELAELRAVVESNRNREKTNEQKAREAAVLVELEGLMAKRRQSTLNNQQPPLLKEVSEAAVEKGNARDKVGRQVDWSGPTVSKAVEVVKAADALKAAGKPEEAKKLITTLNRSVGRAYYDAKESGHITPQVRAAAAPAEQQDSFVTLDAWKAMDDAQRVRVVATPPKRGFTFNRQRTDNIEWAQWSWNPVTGCLHDCSYCYARDIAVRLFPYGFEPTFLPDRLGAPANTPVPIEAATDSGYKNVFTCSMADLFGKWVPREWIEAVLDVARQNRQWNFLFLTKFPLRMAEFDYPDNAWLGTSIDAQARIPNAERAMARVRASVKWLSCEPMLERLTFTRFDLFQWVVIGGASASTQTPEFRPPLEWVVHLHRQARAAGALIYEKTNLLERRREFPGEPTPDPVNVPEAFKMGYLQRDLAP